MSVVSEFISQVQKSHATGMATEHSYRPAFQKLFSDLGVRALNEPKRIACGAPDFIVLRNDLAIGHLEAKDLSVPIRDMKGGDKEQQERYKAALPNLIYTNGLDWDFYRNGELRTSVTTAKFADKVVPKPEEYPVLESLLKDFIEQRPQLISSPEELAKRMAGKATLIKDVLSKTLAQDEDLRSELTGQYKAFKKNLIHDITTEDFADIYAETIAYGMFAARLHDTRPDTFTRQEVLDFLPKSNPFLRALFGYVAGHDLDERIVWIIDDLAQVFQACDVAKLMEGFGALTGKKDPFLHFYETFLASYNPAKRKARGVWYTPEPVVNFIVRSVDEVLKTEFSLPDGLANTSKVTIDWDTGQTDKKGERVIQTKNVHRVQILDPATGTGTFLGEVIKQIKPKIEEIAPGMWSKYIEDDLIPRLHGFELLMASYAMCHMKLDMILTELKYKPTSSPPRLSVYLTNSLEEGEVANQTLPFARWLSEEAKGANSIKRDMPIMCVIGNPPYSGISHNNGSWITNLIEDYKYVDGEHFGERKHWLQDDYVKFIRFSEHLIEKNGEGILGFITNHGYLDNPTFRGMRWHLLNSFDRIWVLDLHGSISKEEVNPDGEPDKNIFDIRQGVAIIIAVKKKNSDKGLAEVWHGDLWGSRDDKYKALSTSKMGELIAERINYTPPQYAFVPRNNELAEIYAQGFGLNEFMPDNVTGIGTMGDGFAIAENAQELSKNMDILLTQSHTEDTLKAKFGLGKNYANWILQNRSDLMKSKLKPVQIAYRPFDTRVTYFDNRILWRWRYKIMRHYFSESQIGLLVSKQVKDSDFAHVFVTDTLSDAIFLSSKTATNAMNVPLYLYPDEQDLDQTRQVNFDPKLWEEMKNRATHPKHGIPDEIAIFDYIYGVLHCPVYRKTYAEPLRIDYPRIPWPTNPDEFWDISGKGTLLRKLHLMDVAAIGKTPYRFVGDGNNVVDKPKFKDGHIWINETTHFADVPEVSWAFFVGGYQPAQKWLKDRKGRELGIEDVKHYQRILKVLSETDRIMQTITMTLPTAP